MGSAQLLMAQKFYQFRELCEENLVGNLHGHPSSAPAGPQKELGLRTDPDDVRLVLSLIQVRPPPHLAGQMTLFLLIFK